MTVLQPLWLRKEDVPELPEGWQALTTVEAADQLKPGKLFDQKTSSPDGDVPVVNQSLDGFVGFHSEEPGVFASIDKPVVTFANHTCAMRLVKQPFSCIQNVFPKVGREGICDTRFFFYAAMGRVDLSDYKGHHPLFRQAYIPIPPLPTQQRIAAILSAYDDLIENNTRRIAILEEKARRLYDEWFVHFRFPGHEEAEFEGDLPRGWSVALVEEFGNVVTGKTPSKKRPEYFDGDIPFLRLPDMHGNVFVISTSDTLTDDGANSQRNKFIPSGSLCVSCIGTVGIVVITSGTCQTNQQINSLVLHDERTMEFMFFALRSLKGTIERYAATGATMANLSRGKFAALELVRPSGQILQRFHGLASPMLNAILNLQQKNANLRAQRDLLLPKLVSGEIDVSAAEAELEAAE